MIQQNEITKELAEVLIENDVFYEAKFYCPDCQDIDDEQYTCTTCWGQGGNTGYKANTILKGAFKLKYNNDDDKSDFTLDEIKKIVDYNNDDNSVWLFFDDYKNILKRDEDEDPEYPDEYRTIDLNTLLNFLLNDKGLQ